MSDFDEQFVNKLKKIDVRTLEKAIAKTVTDIIGVEYNCTIESIEYENTVSPRDNKIKLKIGEKNTNLNQIFEKLPEKITETK